MSATSEFIDYEKRTIKGKSGKVYKIAPEDISVGRWAEFEIRSLTIGFNTDFNTLLTTIREVIDILMNGKGNAQGNAYNAINKLKEFENGIVDYQTNSRAKIIEFISLFVTSENEDKAVHNEEQIRDKYNDWAHIPMMDFFLLCANVIPYFKESYQDMVNKSE